METNNKFCCEKCNYNTNNKCNYNIHLESNKHKNNTEYKCTICYKYFKHKSNLSRHRKACI